MELKEKTLEYSVANVKELMKALMKKALEDSNLRRDLESPTAGKDEVAKYLIALPDDWEKIHISFLDIPLTPDKLVDRFQGIFATEGGYEVSATLGSRCCWKNCRLADVDPNSAEADRE